MQANLVSIIVPCYKQAQYLPETLDSVMAQTYQNWECIIVNDGSPDNTEEIARMYCEKDNRFKYVCQENQGVSAARNNGIKNSIGEYVLPLDADDLIDVTYIEKAINHLNENAHIKLVYCKARKFGKENKDWRLPTYSYRTIIWENCIFCSGVYRRKDYECTIGYNVNMIHGWEDWDFYLSLLNKDDEVYCIDEVLFFYRTKDTSRTTTLVDYGDITKEQIVLNHSDIFSLKGYKQIYRNYQWASKSEKRAIIHKYIRLQKILNKDNFLLKFYWSFVNRIYKTIFEE